jgi:hypothetical protein
MVSARYAAPVTATNSPHLNPLPMGEEADAESKSRAAVARQSGSQIKPSVLEGI